MTNEQLSLLSEQDRELWELCLKATPGPWEYDGCSLTNWHDRTFEMEWIANGRQDSFGDPINENRKADGAFIAAARTALPRLLCEKVELEERERNRFVRCHSCGGALIWKTNDAGEIEVYHDCYHGRRAKEERTEDAARIASLEEQKAALLSADIKRAQDISRLTIQLGEAEQKLDEAEEQKARLERELDDLVKTMRAIMEETVLAGHQGGDRAQTLANVRAMRTALAGLSPADRETK